jgi:predicted amidophosphoribosyltransferase
MMSAICPSCGKPLNEKHERKHEMYLIAHRRAVTKLRNKYLKDGKRCRICGGKLKHYRRMCDRCAIAVRLHVRRRGGFKAWKKGSAGKKPFTKDGV